MSFSTVSSLVSGHRSPRPQHFFPKDFTKTTTTSGSVGSPLIGGFGREEPAKATPPNDTSATRLLPGLLAGGSALGRNSQTLLKVEGAKCINADMKQDRRTFLAQLSTCAKRDTEEKNLLEQDVSLGGLKRELYTLCCSSLRETASADLKAPSSNTHVSPISSLELVALLCLPESAVILDCRTFMAYNANHITGALNVNLSNKISRKRLVDGHVTILDLISGAEAKEEYRRKESTAIVVVYDDNTTDVTSLPAAHPLKLLSNRLQSESRYVKFLDGGLQSFQTIYRQFCEHPDAPPVQPMLYSPTSQDVDIAVDSATASQILPFLFVGNERDASNEQTLKELGITHILNVTAHIPFHFEDTLICKRLQASDSGCQNLKQYFEEAIQFIEGARIGNGRVLVHCQAGVSRSPTIAMAYLISRFDRPLQDVFTLVHSRRNIISPNLNFMGQLLEFSQKPDHADICKSPVPCEWPAVASD